MPGNEADTCKKDGKDIDGSWIEEFNGDSKADDVNAVVEDYDVEDEEDDRRQTWQWWRHAADSDDDDEDHNGNNNDVDEVSRWRCYCSW